MSKRAIAAAASVASMLVLGIPGALAGGPFHQPPEIAWVSIYHHGAYDPPTGLLTGVKRANQDREPEDGVVMRGHGQYQILRQWSHHTTPLQYWRVRYDSRGRNFYHEVAHEMRGDGFALLTIRARNSVGVDCAIFRLPDFGTYERVRSC